MKKIYLMFIALALSWATFGQLTGTYYIPESFGSPGYATIREAITALNVQGVGSGGVTFLIQPGYTETSADSLKLLASGRPDGYLIFKKSGTGANPVLSRSGAGSKATSVLGGQGDAVLTLHGCDYVTFDGLDITTANVGIEYGYFFRKAGPNDGCYNVNIKNCNITMTKSTTATSVAGIYISNLDMNSVVSSATGILIQSAAGRHENITITGNTISAVGTGILIRGFSNDVAPFDFYDKNIVIGAEGQGNTIRNFGGIGSFTASAVNAMYARNLNISYNTIANAEGGGAAPTTTMYGLYMPSNSNNGGGDVVMNANTFSTGMGSGSSAYYHAYVAAVCNSVSLTNNLFSFATPFTSTGAVYLMYVTGDNKSIAITGNSFSGTINRTSTSGSMYGYYNLGSPTGGLETIANNNFSNASFSGSCSFYPIYSNTTASQSKEIYGNVVSNITLNTGTFYGIYSLTGLVSNIYQNQVSGISSAGTTYGLYIGSSSSVTVNAYENVVRNLSTNGSTLYGIYATTSQNFNLYRNNVYDLNSGSTSGVPSGIYVVSGSNVRVYNNFVSDIKAPSSSGANQVKGIHIAGGSYVGVFYNTVYLNAGSGGTNFGTSALYAAVGVPLDLRNNILVNKSIRKGSGLNVVFRRDGAINTGNYNASSNSNDLFATVAPLNYLFYDGSTGMLGKDSTIAMFKTRVGPTRDASSFSEDPPFVNVATTPFNLHLTTGAQSKCESGAVVINSPIIITDDIDAQVRYPDPNCPQDPNNPATAPDVGADEYAGIPSFTCTAPFAGDAVSTFDTVCYGQSITLSLSGAVITGTGNSYQWQKSYDDLNFVNISGALQSTYTFAPQENAFYRCRVTCQNGPVSSNSNSVRVVFASGITSTTPAERCGTGVVKLLAEGTGTNVSWYAEQTGGIALGSGSPFFTPVIDTTTTFYVASELPFPGTVTVGAGATTSATYSNPFYSGNSNTHTQHLIRASELIASGLTPGDITSWGLNITVVGTLPMIDFSLKIATTTANSLSYFVNPAFLTVYTNGSFMPIAGVNMMPFSTPFYWDGTSNIVVEFCHGNPSSSTSMTRTCKADNTPYVSTIKSHRSTSGGTGAAVVCSDTTNLRVTYSVRPQFYINGTVICSTPRQPVVASVVPPPPFEVSTDVTLCNNEIRALSVISDAQLFDTYIWTPEVNLFNDPGCLVPYTGESALTVYVRSTTPGTTTYTCTSTNETTFCANTDQVVVTILPENPVITAAPSALCISGTSTLTVNIPSGIGNATLQWQESTDGTNFTNIQGATSMSYLTPFLGQGMHYRVEITNSNGEPCVAPQYHLQVNNPLITNTTPGFHCGPGVVTLGATTTAGSLQWYNSPDGGTPIGTGNTFTTPYLWESKTYYVSALMEGTTLESAGRLAPTGTTTTGTLNNYGQVFTTYEFIKLQSVDVYPAGAGGQLSLSLYNNALQVMYGPLYFDYPAGNGTTPYTIPLNFEIPAGVGYRLMINVMVGGPLIRQTSSVTYPINNGTLVSMTAGATSLTANSSTVYNWFYNWRVFYGCVSPPVSVLATINLAPFYELTQPQALCNDQQTTLTVVNGTSYFNTFKWSPAANLFTDNACTIPYNADSSATTVYFKATTPGYYEVRGYANNTVNGCNNYDTTHVVVLPSEISITSSSDSLCVIDDATLSVSPVMNYGATKIQWYSSADGVTYSSISGATSSTYNTGNITATTWYKVTLTNTNLVECVSAVKKIYVDSPSILTTTPGERCGTGTVTLAATSSPGTTINWFANSGGGLAIGTGPTFTTPIISATKTYYVSATSGNGGGEGAVGPVDNTIGTGGTGFMTYYLTFDVLSSSMTLKGVHVYPAAAGDVKMVIYNPSGTIIDTIIQPVTTTDIGQKTYVSIETVLPAGFNYRIGINTTATPGGVSLYRNTAGASFPYTLPGVVSITGNTFSGYPEYYYYCYDWRVSTKCSSPTVPVVATVTPAIPVNITPAKTICINDVQEIKVTSNVAEYNVYTWSPINDLFLDAACNIAYSVGASASTVYFKSATAKITDYLCTAINTINGCNDTATTRITVMPNPEVTSIPASICVSGNATMRLNPSTGYGAATFQWYSSADSITFSQIEGATGSTYTTPTLTSSMFYKVVIRNSYGNICSEPVKKMVVNNPQLLSTTPATRCGVGTVTLQAEGTGGTVNWYATALGGVPIGTGPSFTTPELTSTTNYYAAVSSGTTAQYVGMASSTNGTSGVGTSTYGLYFDVFQPMTLYSVVLYPNATTNNTPGTVTISVINGSGAVLNQAIVNVTGYNQSTTPTSQEVILNFNMMPATGLRLVMSSFTGISGLMFQPAAQGPYPYPYTIPGVVSITSGTYSGTVYPSLYYYFYNWLVTTGCETPRAMVTATVTGAPALGITGDQTLCIDQVQQLTVTSVLSDYDNYTWTPVTNLFSDAACTTPYVAGTSLTTVYVKSPTAGLVKYRCTGLNTVNLCQNIAESSITTLPVPTITSYPESLCLTGVGTLSLLPATGYGAATFQWQQSADNVTFTDIAGATNQTYTTNTIDTTTYYRVVIYNSLGVSCSSSSYAMQVNEPQILTTAPGSRCGTGAVNLAATGTPGATLKWYSAATGGLPLANGNSYTTPVISTTTTYFVDATQGESTGYVGMTNLGTNVSGTGGGTTSYMAFTAYSNFTLLTVNIYPYGTGPGTVDIQLRTSTGTTIMSKTVNLVGSNSPTQPPQTVTLNFPISGGASYRLGVANYTGGVSNMYRDYTGSTAVNFPYPYEIPGVVGITGNNLGNYYYYFFYNWQVTKGCTSQRTPVTATITPPPAITASATPNSICAGEQALLNVTSDNTNYTYNWMPGDLSGASHSVTPTITTQYTVTANDAVTGCVNVANTTVSVKVTPPPVTVTPAFASLNPGDVQQLVSSGGNLSGTGTFGAGTAMNTTSGYPAPYTNYYGGAKHQMLIRASELTAAGFYPGSTVNTITFQVGAIGADFTGSLSSFRIDMGHTTATALTSSSFVGGLTNVLPAATYPVTLGNNTHTLTTPFVWNGIDNIVIQTSYSNGNTGGSTDAVQMYQTEAGFTGCNWYRVDGATAADVFSATTPTSSGTVRPNMVLGFGTQVTKIWSPTIELFKDAAATQSYAGESLGTVYAQPYLSRTYTVTYTAPSSGCTATATAELDVIFPCFPPADVTVGSITATTAAVSWTAPSIPPANGYEYEVRTIGDPGSGPVGLQTGGTTGPGVTFVNLTELSGNTTYHVYVRSDCGDNVYSGWTLDYFFTTPVAPLVVNADVTHNTCAYSCDGSIFTTVTGGIPPYTYLWGEGETASSISNLCGGTFYVTVTDAALTTVTNNWTVNEPGEISVIANSTDVTCFGSSDGIISIVSVTGGTSPYSYLWSTGATSQNISGLSAGSYSCTVSDANQCNAMLFRTIYQPDAITLNATTGNAVCPENPTGSVDLTVSGGVPGYTYMWSNGTTTQDLTGVTSGDYTVTVTDVNLCQKTGTYTIDNTNAICDNISVTGNLTTTECYNALETITVAGLPQTFVVQASGEATFIAGQKISFLPGTTVVYNGKMIGKIAPSGPWCNTPPITASSTVMGKDEIPMVTDHAGFTLYPNPTNGDFTIVRKGDKIFDNVRIEVYSLSGEKIMTGTMVGQKHDFHFSEMASGLYFVRIVADEYVETIKLVKTR